MGAQRRVEEFSEMNKCLRSLKEACVAGRISQAVKGTFKILNQLLQVFEESKIEVGQCKRIRGYKSPKIQI